MNIEAGDETADSADRPQSSASNHYSEINPRRNTYATADTVWAARVLLNTPRVDYLAMDACNPQVRSERKPHELLTLPNMSLASSQGKRDSPFYVNAQRKATAEPQTYVGDRGSQIVPQVEYEDLSSYCPMQK